MPCCCAAIYRYTDDDGKYDGYRDDGRRYRHGGEYGDGNYRDSDGDDRDMYDYKDEYKEDYKDEYREDYKDDYKDEYKDDYRDEYKDEYKDDYRDDYKDEYKDDYRDDYKDDYKDGGSAGATDYNAEYYNKEAKGDDQDEGQVLCALPTSPIPPNPPHPTQPKPKLNPKL